MQDKNLDEDGYLTYTPSSSSLRHAVAKALREIDFHSNRSFKHWSEDFIYGRSGIDRQDYMRIYGDHYAYTQLAAFLFAKGFLKVLIKCEHPDGRIEANIIFPEFDKASFKRKIVNINGPQFSKELGLIVVEQQLIVFPIHNLDPHLHKNILFSVELKPGELEALTYRGNKIYCLDGTDILFPKNYNPFVS